MRSKDLKSIKKLRKGKITVYDSRLDGLPQLQVTDQIVQVDREGIKIIKSREKIDHSWGEAAAAFNSDHFLLTGGRGSNGFLSDSSLQMTTSYEPTKVRPMPKARARHAMVALEDGNFLVVGGITKDDDESLCLAKEIIQYDVHEDRWHSFSQIPLGAAQLVAERIEDKLIIIAGDTGTTTEPERPVAPARTRDEVQILNLGTGEWSEGTSKPKAETGVTSAVKGHEIYVASSYEDDFGRINALVEVYNVAENTWRRIPDMPTPRTGVPVGFLGDNLYCINGLGRGLKPLSCIEVYDTEKNLWFEMKSAPPACYSCAYAAIKDEALLLFGGRRDFI